MLAFTILLPLLTVVTSARANQFGQYGHPLAKRQYHDIPYYTTNVPGYNISMPVDHFNQSDTRVYNNQYWVNDTWYQPGGPLIFFQLGESGATPYSINQVLANDQSNVMALAKQYHGLAIAWEHRYFGGSLPFPRSPNARISNPGGLEPVGNPASLKYLTIEQALQDVVYFAHHIDKGTYQPNEINSLFPSKTPWIAVGGSYPGVLSALLRIRNPEVIHAAWASSAPVEAMYSGASYLSPIARSLPSNCSTDVQAIVKYIDQVLAGSPDSPEYMEIQNLTLISGIAGISGFNQSFNYQIAQGYSPYGIALSMRNFFTSYYQTFGPALVTHPFCDALESYNPSVPGTVPNNSITSILSNPGNGTPDPQGFLATHNNNLTLGVQAYFYAGTANANYLVNNILLLGVPNTTFQNDTASYASQRPAPIFDRSFLDDPLSVGDDNSFADNVAWQYLLNTEFGWFQAWDGNQSTPGNNITSHYINVTSFQQTQRRANFNNATIATLPARPNVTTILQYGGWNMTPSNVMFTDGAADPWRAGTVFSEELNLGGPNRSVTTTVPACGKAPEANQVYGALYVGASHVWDLFAQPFTGVNGAGLSSDGQTPQEIGLELFINALDVWLPCFNATT